MCEHITKEVHYLDGVQTDKNAKDGSLQSDEAGKPAGKAAHPARLSMRAPTALLHHFCFHFIHSSSLFETFVS